VAVVDGIGGTITRDKEGNDNQLKLLVSAIGDSSHGSHFFFFRLRRQHAMPVYLRIRVHTAIDAGTSVYLDEMAVVQATELYVGGPYAALFAGATAAVTEDKWTLTVTNDRAGEFQTWYDRAFDMRSKGLLLPSSGSTLIPDTLIA